METYYIVHNNTNNIKQLSTEEFNKFVSNILLTNHISNDITAVDKYKPNYKKEHLFIIPLYTNTSTYHKSEDYINLIEYNYTMYGDNPLDNIDYKFIKKLYT